jgi:hypothetical protein
VADTYKATWFLEYGRGGYSFSHWSQLGGYQLVLDAAVRLAKVYMSMLGGGVLMNYIRVSLEGLRGDSQVSTQAIFSYNKTAPPPPGLGPGAVIGNSGGPGNPLAPVGIQTSMNGPPDYWNTAALLRLGNSPTAWGHQFIRLIPDDLTILPAGVTGNAGWDNNLQAYFDQLIGDGWGLFAVNRDRGYQVNILGIAKDVATGIITLTTAAPPNPWQVGQKVRVSGAVTTTGLNQVWIIAQVPDATHIVLAFSNNATFTNPVKSFGQVWSLNKVFALYKKEQMQLVRETSRRAGRPFDVLLGRRKKQTKK